ncbi:hypothetical protein ACHAXS_010657, partial [Conticribra weissflogii]
ALPSRHRRAFAFSPLRSSPSGDDDDDDDETAIDEATRLREKARRLRSQIQQMEDRLGSSRLARSPSPSSPPSPQKSLRNKRVLVLGANGRLGSMIARRLLRNHPELAEVVAAVHYVGRSTTRGWGRLSYEVGAEDGVGSLGPAWSSDPDDRNASFRYDPRVMDGYNLDKLRVVEVELLDPVQVRTICEGVDAVIFCATDFEGNRPRAIASLNAAFLFRAVASPTKGRVEVEGVRNALEGLTGELVDRRWKGGRERERGTNDDGRDDVGPTRFVLVSTAPDVFGEFETPFGEFHGLKRQAERIVSEEFPSLTYSILQMGLYDERVEEGLEIRRESALDEGGTSEGDTTKGIKRINRRDAARAAVEALLDEDLVNRKVRVFTAIR